MKGSICAIITPFKESGSIDEDSWKNLVRWHEEENTDALLIGGTTGEGPTLTWQELCKLTNIAKKTLQKEIPLIVNTGTNCTKTSVEKTKIAKDYGANMVLVVAPYYNKPPFSGIVTHLEHIEKVELPMIFYHHPGRTGISLTEKQLIEIAKIKGVFAIKEASGDLDLVRKILSIDPNIILFSGNDEQIVPFMQLGGKGSISVVANLIPSFWKSIIHSGLQGNYLDMKTSFQKIKKLIQALLQETNPIPVKYALSLLEKCKNSLRLPLVSAEKSTQDNLQESMSQIFSSICNI